MLLAGLLEEKVSCFVVLLSDGVMDTCTAMLCATHGRQVAFIIIFKVSVARGDWRGWVVCIYTPTKALFSSHLIDTAWDSSVCDGL